MLRYLVTMVRFVGSINVRRPERVNLVIFLLLVMYHFIQDKSCSQLIPQLYKGSMIWDITRFRHELVFLLNNKKITSTLPAATFG